VNEPLYSALKRITKAPTGGVVLAIKDNGAEIASDVLPKIQLFLGLCLL
jgi:hypothetical protein